MSETPKNIREEIVDAISAYTKANMQAPGRIIMGELRAYDFLKIGRNDLGDLFDAMVMDGPVAALTDFGIMGMQVDFHKDPAHATIEVGPLGSRRVQRRHDERDNNPPRQQR